MCSNFRSTYSFELFVVYGTIFPYMKIYTTFLKLSHLYFQQILNNSKLFFINSYSYFIFNTTPYTNSIQNYYTHKPNETNQYAKPIDFLIIHIHSYRVQFGNHWHEPYKPTVESDDQHSPNRGSRVLVLIPEFPWFHMAHTATCPTDCIYLISSLSRVPGVVNRHIATLTRTEIIQCSVSVWNSKLPIGVDSELIGGFNTNILSQGLNNYIIPWIYVIHIIYKVLLMMLIHYQKN